MRRKILFLEHDEDDVYIAQSFFDEMGYDVDLEFVNSPEAVENALSEAVNKGSGLPDLFLMDYNAVPEHAEKFIARLKSNRHFRAMPVIVLRGTADPVIVKACYASGASSYIEKPANSDDIKEKITALFRYWFFCVELPAAV